MEPLSYENFILSDLDSIKEFITGCKEDLVIEELMRLTPKILNNFYSFKNPDPVHKLCKVCEYLQISLSYDEYRIFNVLEDILTCIDSLTLPEFLNYLETATKHISKKENENKCRSIILRICNSLFKRLGKKDHRELRTSLHTILVNCMGSITERSGVNFRGQISNKKLKNVMVCDSLYSRVCQVLICSKDPYTYIRDSSKLDRILENIEKVLDDLSEIQTFDNSFLCCNPIEEIFDLQIKDKDFLVYLVSSVFIMTQTLLKPATKTQETLIFISDTHKQKLSNLASKSSELISKINPNYLKNFETITKNELEWVSWKYNKCNNFERASFDEHPKEIKVELEDGELESEEVVVDKPQPLFEPTEMEPSLDNFVNRVLVDLDPDEGIEDEYKSMNDPVFSWRFLRMISFRHIHEFLNETKPNIEVIAKKLRPDEENELPVKRSSSMSSSGSKRSKKSNN